MSIRCEARASPARQYSTPHGKVMTRSATRKLSLENENGASNGERTERTFSGWINAPGANELIELIELIITSILFLPGGYDAGDEAQACDASFVFREATRGEESETRECIEEKLNPPRQGRRFIARQPRTGPGKPPFSRRHIKSPRISKYCNFVIFCIRTYENVYRASLIRDGNNEIFEDC